MIHSNERIRQFYDNIGRGDVVILDGATGTQLLARGVSTKLPLWSTPALWDAPAVVRDIHLDYINSGADIITTNTFRTNVRVLRNAAPEWTCAKLTELACRLAIEARELSGRNDVLIAGCIAPVEDCYQPGLVPSEAELLEEHRELAAALSLAGVDFIFVETMNSSQEAMIALRAASETGLPVALSLVGGARPCMLNGDSFSSLGGVIEECKPLFVAINCVPPDSVESSLTALRDVCSAPLGVYANGDGCPEAQSGWMHTGKGTPAQSYLDFAKKWYELGARVIGGCCGTGPEYISILSRHFEKQQLPSVAQL